MDSPAERALLGQSARLTRAPPPLRRVRH